MKYRLRPARVGSLALSIFLSTTTFALAQDAEIIPLDCPDCETDMVKYDLGPAPEEVVDIVLVETPPTDRDETTETGITENDGAGGNVTDPDVVTVDTDVYFDNNGMDIYASVSLPSETAAPEPAAIMEMAAVDATQDSGTIAPELAPDSSPDDVVALQNTAAPTRRSDDDQDPFAVAAVAQNNICTDRVHYVALLCAWQGYPQP